MNEQYNHLGQAIGFALEDWRGCLSPPRSVIEGSYCRVEPLVPDIHAKALYQAYAKNKTPRDWTYLSYGPFADLEEYQTWLQTTCKQKDLLFHAIIDLKSQKAVGVASYLRIVPEKGVIEVGHIHYSPQLQKTPAATEAMYLMMKRVFDELGYRRYEWKCDALNARSRNAALRLGFSFEGIFRQVTVYKGRNRDTAWYSILDKEWPVLKKAYEAWLDPKNFDTQNRQRKSLRELIRPAK